MGASGQANETQQIRGGDGGGILGLHPAEFGAFALDGDGEDFVTGHESHLLPSPGVLEMRLVGRDGLRQHPRVFAGEEDVHVGDVGFRHQVVQGRGPIGLRRHFGFARRADLAGHPASGVEGQARAHMTAPLIGQVREDGARG
jgi:hypothetical protein